MWGDNTNGLSSSGLLRPTDRSSVIRRNYIIIIIYQSQEITSTSHKFRQKEKPDQNRTTSRFC